jgi:hypothetical protein
MKKIILSVLILLSAFSFAAAQRGTTGQKGTTAQKEKPVKQVQVTAQTIASQPAGKPYVIDLTRNGTIYTLDVGIDYSRVRVRTPKGEMVLSDAIKKVSLKQPQTGGKLLLGSLSDLRDPRPDGGTIERIDCDGAATCSCKGFSDCLRLVLLGCCRVDLDCSGDGCWCWKYSKCTGVEP